MVTQAITYTSDRIVRTMRLLEDFPTGNLYKVDQCYATPMQLATSMWLLITPTLVSHVSMSK